MKAIDKESGEVLATELKSSEIDALRAQGAEVEMEDAPDGDAGGSAEASEDDVPDAITDEEEPEVSKVDEHGDQDEIPEDYATSDEDFSRDEMEWELDEDEEVETAELDGFEAQYEQVQREQEMANSDLEQDRQEREERIASGKVRPNDDYHGEVGSQTIRDALNESGQADQIVEAFEKFKTEDRWVQGEEGERLNDNAVIDLVAGDTSAQHRLRERKLKAETGDRAVAVSMDMSGSMKGVDKEAKCAMGALAIACREIGDDFVANSWTSTEQSGKENQRITMVTGPDEEFEWRHLDAVWPNYQDPITPGMRHAKQMCDEVTASERMMVVITDGQPQMCASGRYNALDAVNEAKEEARKYRAEGYTVIGLGIEPGADEELMQQMFGEGGYLMSNEDNIADRLISIYEDQMNVSGGR